MNDPQPTTAKVSELSLDFSEYHPESRAKYEGTHVFVGVHLPIEWVQHLTLRSMLDIRLVTDDDPDPLDGFEAGVTDR